MKKLFFTILIIATLTITSWSQACEGFYPLKTGTVIEMQSFSAKDKLTATNRQTILEADETDEGLIIKVKSEQFDEKGNAIFEQELQMRCKDNVFYMDMESFLDPNTMKSMQDMEVTVDASDLAFPSRMEVGQTLPDGSVSMKVSGGMAMLNMTVNIINRKVEAFESITVPAGTFDCYKITYDTDVKSIVKVTTTTAEWIAKNVGMVRSETYDKKGKLTGYTVLSKFIP
jgi:hypothetical protein